MPTLQWLTRNKDVKAAAHVPYHVIKEDPKFSYGSPDSENMLIQGDNLIALKSLLPFYAGQVKCIYIDPPYNTGSAFEHYDDNLEHTIWLSIMMARLCLLRDFLRLDGTIWIQIDDDEQAYLKVLCDEVFGRNNFITTLCVKMSHLSGVKMSHKEKNFPKLKEYILVYSKSKEHLKLKSQYEKCTWDEAFDRYTSYIVKDKDNPDDVSLWKRIPLSDALKKAEINRCKEGEKFYHFCMQHADCIFRTARTTSAEFTNLPNDDLFREVKSARGLRKLAFKREEVLLCSEKLKVIDGERTPALPVGDMWGDAGINNLHNEGGVSFKNGKKPERLLRKILSFATNPGDLVLDSFLGSGTTAAVAHKMGRRYIGIEMGEQCITHCYKRLKNVVEGEDKSGITKLENWTGGGGFRFYHIGGALFDKSGLISRSITFGELAAHIWFTETYTPFTPKTGKLSPILGAHEGVVYVVLHKKSSSSEILTSALLNRIKVEMERQRYSDIKKIVVYGESCRMGKDTMRLQGVVFKQIPYDVKGN